MSNDKEVTKPQFQPDYTLEGKKYFGLTEERAASIAAVSLEDDIRILDDYLSYLTREKNFTWTLSFYATLSGMRKIMEDELEEKTERLLMNFCDPDPTPNIKNFMECKEVSQRMRCALLRTVALLLMKCLKENLKLDSKHQMDCIQCLRLATSAARGYFKS